MRQQVEYWCSSIHWKLNNKQHRDGDLPSYYRFYNGKLFLVYYCQHGKFHRTTGSAIIYYKYKIKRYWYQDREYASLEELLMMEVCR